MDSPITNLIERGLTSFWRVLKVSYIEKNDLYRLHFGYKSCFSFSNVAFRVQKLRFVYKYLIVNLQNCISNYKVASRNAIQLRPFSALHYLRLVRIVGEKLKKSKDIFDFACIYDIIYT